MYFGQMTYGSQVSLGRNLRLRFVWTQVLLQWATSKGYISEDVFVKSSALLMGFGYSFTSLSVPVIAAAAKIANWDRSEFPYGQFSIN